MKKFLFAVLLTAATFFAQAQTKGTNAIGLGLNTKSTTDDSQTTTKETKDNTYNIGYGYFIRDNVKIGVDVNYETTKNTTLTKNTNTLAESNTKSYGGGIYGQKYYGLFKTIYAFGGVKAAYTNSKEETVNSVETITSNDYSLSAYGGFAWFISKHIALETDLLNVSATYSKAENTTSANPSTSSSTKFNLSSSGTLTGLGFRVFLLF